MESVENIEEIANNILSNASLNGEQIHRLMRHDAANRDLVKYVLVLEELSSTGLIIAYENVPGKTLFKLTKKGFELKESGKGYSNYLKQEHEKEQKRIQKEARDEQIKVYQHEDLKRKVNEMNQAQLDFWRRQRQQFWLTFIIALAGFILGIINFVKLMIIK